MEVPYLDLKAQYADLREEILAALDRVGRNAAFVLGEEVQEFEKQFAAYCEAKHCVGVNSGTSGLHLALLAVGVRPGDEVITTPNTFIATAEAITYTGATPVFVDIDPRTANIDPAKIEAAVTARTRAVLPVHLYGRPAEMDPILEIARHRGLAVIEDACQAHGARYRGRRVGGIGDAAAFSFYPSKNLGAYGEGGALVTNDDSVAARARMLRHHGQAGAYLHETVGFNYRMDGFQGAVLRVKLKYLDRWNARRKELVALYRRFLTGTQVEIPEDSRDDERVHHLFVVYVANRDVVRSELAARGVHTSVHYPIPIHLQKAYQSLGYRRGSFPHTERACERVISMPLYPELTEEQVRYAAETLAETAGKSHTSSEVGR